MINNIIHKLYGKFKIHVRDFFINIISASMMCPKCIRYVILKIYGVDVNTANICPKCFFGSNKISIGNKSFVNYGCFFDALSKINIGNNVSIGYHTMFVTASHHININWKFGGGVAGKAYGKPITVGDASWIGANCIVLGGVTIEEGCIIAAGSLVNKDCEKNCMYAGVPAIKIKELK